MKKGKGERERERDTGQAPQTQHTGQHTTVPAVSVIASTTTDRQCTGSVTPSVPLKAQCPGTR